MLSRILGILKFCGGHNLALRGHDERESSSNRGIFLDMVTYTRSIDVAFDDYLKNNQIAKNTSKIVLNELLECCLQVYLHEVKSELQATNIVSVQADETTDITCKSQMILIREYICFFSILFMLSQTKRFINRSLQQTWFPHTVEIRWNFNFRALRSILENKENLVCCFELIQCEVWDATTVSEATGVLKLLKYQELLFF